LTSFGEVRERENVPEAHHRMQAFFSTEQCRAAPYARDRVGISTALLKSISKRRNATVDHKKLHGFQTEINELNKQEGQLKTTKDTATRRKRLASTRDAWNHAEVVRR
jgi:hypothetical protein